jgi:hypothetical protein
VTFLQHPEQLQEMLTDPSLMPSAVEELLRYHTASALATRRVATQDVEVAGQVTRLLQLLELIHHIIYIISYQFWLSSKSVK